MKVLALGWLTAVVIAETKVFDGPFTGLLNSGTSGNKYVEAERDTCILNNIKSCNSAVTHSAAWCYLKLSFTDCSDVEAVAESC